MPRRIKHSSVEGETTVIRLKQNGDAETWLVVDTVCEANDPELRNVVSEALAVLSADKDLNGVEVLTSEVR